MLILLISYNTHRRRVEIEGGTERIFILQILCTDVEQRRTRRILVLHVLPSKSLTDDLACCCRPHEANSNRATPIIIYIRFIWWGCF